MVATLAQMASAEYYLESQRSYRHPNEYYTAGEEPDGVWFNPHGLFGLADGGKVDSGDFHRLYNGFAPDGSGKLTRNAGSAARSPGLDMTFSVDKSVSALWAIAEPDMRAEIEQLAVSAARAALEDTVLKYCSYTRITEGDEIVPVPADLIAATFPHGTSRENDPQLHIHTTILNVARTHRDGKYRAHHQYPAYSWSKAAGALFRAYLAWNMQQSLGAKMEQYGPNSSYTRIPDMPEDLLSFWSKRRKAIIAKAGELGIPVRGNASRLAGVNKLTRAGKSHDNDPEIRHRRWRSEAEGFTERETLIATVTGNEVNMPRERIRELTEQLDGLPAYLAREEAVFGRPDMVEAAANRAAGLLGREAVTTAIERVRRNPEIEALELPKATAESNASMAHTERYSTRHNLGMEQAVRDMAGTMASDTGHGLPAPAIETKVETLLADGYPLSGEQISAIRHATSRGARVAVIEGAAGSGKTTTLRPTTDLHREHGYEIVPTAVAWRTAVALGNDCEARPFCVDKLLKLAAHGQMEIGKNTLIVVDEAGMLSTRQAHHILQLSERHGAKIVFAGDTRQQQPVEAGPGLRLIRDVAGSVRVDRIRRQKADLEDVLVHVHGEAPEMARFQAGLTGREERDRVLSEYEALPDDEKPSFTPWQVTASEALRDGDAASAIEALRVRGRFHICHDEENTLTRLVEDWARGVREEPDKSSIVLARTRAETRALSHLMRERHLAGKTDTARVIVEVSRNAEDGRIIEPLEIAVGDRLRIGATQWEKQLFNGTIVTVEELRVLRGGAGRSVHGTGHGSEPMGPSVEITARTDEGREVIFRHDEIRDYHDNIRLDYGYALTITSAQGLTVDRAYLLADDRPARETIYPAATRHREGLDIYVNRAPPALAVAERRPEDQAERPVMDADIRAHLAERWSRSQPKEAALDYITDGAWRNQREAAGRREYAARAGERLGAAANDNALNRIAGEIRRTAFGWRHGQTVAAFADGRRRVLAAYDDLRERTRAEGDAVALGGTFRETITRHGVLLKQAEAFRARPTEFGDLLAERGGIGRKDLDAFEELHARASRHRRAATMRHAHRIRREAEQPTLAPIPEQRQGELARVDRGAEAPSRADTVTPDKAVTSPPDRAGKPGGRVDPVPPPGGEDQAGALAAAAKEHVPDPEPVDPDWRQEAGRHVDAGVPILTDGAAHGPHPDNIAIGGERMNRAPSDLGDTIRDNDEELVERRAREQRERTRQSASLTFASDTGAAAAGADPARADARGLFSRLRHALNLDGRSAERDRQARIEANTLITLGRWERLRGDWNRQVEQAEHEGVHVIHTYGYERLHSELRSMAHANPYLDDRIRSEMESVLIRLGKAKRSHEHVERYRYLLEDRLKYRRDLLEPGAAERGVAVPDHADYDGWRDLTDETVDTAGHIVANREDYGVHLDSTARRGGSLGSALSRLREALHGDDRHIAAALVRQPKGDDVRTREERIARLLDDPEKFRQLRQQRAERKAGRRQSKGRYQSRGMSM